MKNLHKLLIIGTVWPEPNSSAAGSRMIQLINLFLSEGFDVTFASTASESEFMFDLEHMGVKRQYIKLNCGSFDVFVSALQPDIVLFDRFMIEEQFGWRVTEQCPNAVKVLDTEDLHCLRYCRQEAFKQGREFNVYDLLEADIAKREIASIYRCDISLIISPYEMFLLKSLFNVDENLLFYLPFILPKITSTEQLNLKSYEQRKHFISIGNFLHEPNWNAVLYLKEEIWPLIKKQLPNTELHVYGAYPSQKVFNLHNEKQGFIIKGRAENANAVMQNAKVCLAPLRFGAGLKGKLIEAMQNGTPSVTTDIGAEAMHSNLPWNGFIANDKEAFANKAVKLYTDRGVWEKAVRNGFEILNTCYPVEHALLFIKKLKELKIELHSHRRKNFIGSLLNHNTMAALKYMSKWIEEKNKKV
ncbi:glycosyltransferase [Pseudoxanthomonas sp. SGD-10]|nr:glycosyltransferase [Pseudoxanthomonas sp. SGD-10]